MSDPKAKEVEDELDEYNSDDDNIESLPGDKKVDDQK